MKTLILILMMATSFLATAADVTVTIDGERYYCSRDGSPPQDREWRCVLNCESRSSSGACRRYNQDFCGYDAVCTEQCVSRSSSGACNRYGPDICRANP